MSTSTSLPSGKSYAWNIEPIGYTDLIGKPAFKMALHQAGDRWYLYTATFWHPGWHIVDVTDPAKPRHIRFIDGPENTWTLQIQIADGKMITSHERIADGWGHDPSKPFGEGMQVWSLEDPENPKILGEFKTGGEGTHRNYYDGGRYVYVTGLPEGYDGHILQIVDIADPANPVEVSRWWREGQHVAGGEAGVSHGTLLHGGAYVKGDRAYLPYSAGGFVILDIADKTKPTMVSDLPFSPPFLSFIGVHTALPQQDRDIVIVNSEAIREMCQEPLGHCAVVDISDESDPHMIALMPLPEPPPDAPYRNFCEKGGRFGPHNQHQPQYQPHLYQNCDLVFLTYFNAGLRIYDVSDPRLPKEVAWFLPPDPTERRGLLPASKLVAQTEDVVVDRRGNIFISDKNHGIYVLRWDGLPPSKN